MALFFLCIFLLTLVCAPILRYATNGPSTGIALKATKMPACVLSINNTLVAEYLIRFYAASTLPSCLKLIMCVPNQLHEHTFGGISHLDCCGCDRCAKQKQKSLSSASLSQRLSSQVSLVLPSPPCTALTYIGLALFVSPFYSILKKILHVWCIK